MANLEPLRGSIRRGVLVALGGAALCALAGVAQAAEAPAIDSGDTAWMLTSAALVLMMTAPGLALFYGGLVRSKNVLNLLMQSFIMVALISIQWVLWDTASPSAARAASSGGCSGSGCAASDSSRTRTTRRPFRTSASWPTR
jgi:hypothetical protein